MRRLVRIRWGVRAVLILGVAASVAANILHATDNPISQTIAAWPPLALLLTVELISRVPVHSRGLAAVRVAATTLIAGIAAWVSYWHMAGVAERYGETGAAPYLIPVSVDGLIVVASICLVELGGRIRGLHQEPTSHRATGPLSLRWDYERPIGPMPAEEPAIGLNGGRVPGPAAPVQQDPVPPRRTPRVLTAAERVANAHRREPQATHARIAELADVSLSTVKRHRPALGSLSVADAAETINTAGSRELAGAAR